MSDLKIGGIGDSIMSGYGLSAGEDPLTQCALALEAASLFGDVAVTNRAIPGAATGDWLSGSSNLNNAKSAFASASVTHIMIVLGANDAATANHVSAATYNSNLGNILTDLIAAGYIVILGYPTFIPAGANGGATDATSVTLTQEYLLKIDARINGTTILQGDTGAWGFFNEHYAAQTQADLTHPTAGGAIELGRLYADGIEVAFESYTFAAMESGAGFLLENYEHLYFEQASSGTGQFSTTFAGTIR